MRPLHLHVCSTPSEMQVCFFVHIKVYNCITEWLYHAKSSRREADEWYEHDATCRKEYRKRRIQFFCFLNGVCHMEHLCEGCCNEEIDAHHCDGYLEDINAKRKQVQEPF